MTMNDNYRRVKKEIEWLACNFQKSENLEYVNQNYKESIIGLGVDHIKKANYASIYFNLLSDGNYDILFTDCSIINFRYIFDGKKQIKTFSISYIPALESEDYYEEQYAKYMRFDYSPNDQVDIEHTACHLHVGLLNEEFRIPIQTLLYPKDIIYIILCLL